MLLFINEEVKYLKESANYKKELSQNQWKRKGFSNFTTSHFYLNYNFLRCWQEALTIAKTETV